MTKTGRWVAIGLLGVGLVGGPSGLAAQQDLDDFDIPRWMRGSVADVWYGDETEHFDGDTEVATDELVRGSLVVVGGILQVDGVIEGDVVVVNGDLEFGPEGYVDGDATVLGGSVGDATRVMGTTRVYRETVGVRDSDAADRRARDQRAARERDERADPWEDDEWEDEERERDRRRRSGRSWDGGWWGGGDAGLTGRLGPTYNRTEGLPIGLGPRIRVGGPAPLEIEALAILRTATSFDNDADEFDDDEIGYSFRIEQRVGYEAQGIFGGRIYSIAEGVEDWGLSDAETSLATLLWREDFRDYYDRKGWTVHAGVRVPEAGLRFVVDYRDDEYGFRPVADPWTLFGGDDPWRPQPLVAEGDMRSIGAELRIDLPDQYGPYGGGWSLHAEARRGLEGQLTVPGHTTAAGFDVPFASFDAEDVRYGFVDLRRYNHLGWNNTIDLRFLAGGSLTGDPLPPQFQHAFGGVGSVPGHDLFIGDCGARDVLSIVARPGGGRSRQSTFSNYGCDRFVLFQAEYRGGLDFNIGWDDDRDRNPDNWGNWEEWDRGRDRFHADFEWSIFFDAGRGWALSADDPQVPRYDTDTLMDVGFGFWLGELGVLAAVPLDTEDHPVRWFLRLEHRF